MRSREADLDEAEEYQRSSEKAKEHPGDQTPQTGLSGEDQAGGAAALQTGSSRDKRRADASDWIVQGGSSRRSPHPLDWSIRGKEVARSEGDRRARPSRSSDAVLSGCNAKENALEMQ